jgi:nucleosome binding factor SPN SPT16 subunit
MASYMDHFCYTLHEGKQIKYINLFLLQFNNNFILINFTYHCIHINTVPVRGIDNLCVVMDNYEGEVSTSVYFSVYIIVILLYDS